MLLKCFGLTGLVAASLSGCAGNTPTAATPAPTAQPSPPPGDSIGLLWGFVVEHTGACIADATVEIVAGQGMGQRATQTSPCSVWDYDGGFIFDNLEPGVELTVRASAPGYRSADRTFVASSRSHYQAVDIVLERED
jgi:hypothetical protein